MVAHGGDAPLLEGGHRGRVSNEDLVVSLSELFVELATAHRRQEPQQAVTNVGPFFSRGIRGEDKRQGGLVLRESAR